MARGMTGYHLSALLQREPPDADLFATDQEGRLYRIGRDLADRGPGILVLALEPVEQIERSLPEPGSS